MGTTHNLSSIAAPTKIFSFKKIFGHLSAVVDAVRGGRVWGAQVHHHVPLGPVIGGVSPEVSPLPHMVTSLQHPASLTSTDHCNSNSLRTRGGFFYHFTVSIHCIVWRKEGGDRICVECRYIWKCGFSHQSCRGDGKSTNFYSLLQFLPRPAVAVSDEWWWWWHVTRDTWHWIMTRVPAARGTSLHSALSPWIMTAVVLNKMAHIQNVRIAHCTTLDTCPVKMSTKFYGNFHNISK